MSSLGFILSTILAQAKQPLLVVTPDHDTLIRLAEACDFFNKHAADQEAIPILHFPGWETLPYDHFSSHPDIISQRLKTLYQLPTLKTGMVITTIDAMRS